VGSHTKNIQNQFLDLLSSARIVAQPETIASERLPGSSFPVPPSEAAAPHVSSPAPRENSLIPLIPIEIKNLPNSADNFSEIRTLFSVARNGVGRLGGPECLSPPGRPLFGAIDTSSYELAKDLKVTQKTAWFMLQRIREALRDERTHKFGFGGPVESDETFIGPIPQKLHREKRLDYHNRRGKGMRGNMYIGEDCRAWHPGSLLSPSSRKGHPER
jgi:hypothetical protein